MKLHQQLESAVYRSVAKVPGSPRHRSVLIRLVTDGSFAMRAIRYALRLPTPLTTEDRRVLERVIFPYYSSRPDIRSVLFVGCEWYTSHYNRAFFHDHDYWTIEPSAQSRKHGGPRHVVAPLERLSEFFRDGYFDLIICNGVYGFGLDSLEQCEAAFTQCHSRLRAGGHLVFGWTDVPARTPVPLESIGSLNLFNRFVFPPFDSWRYVTDTPYAHTYDFYCK
jgi:hypothetical protein